MAQEQLANQPQQHSQSSSQGIAHRKDNAHTRLAIIYTHCSYIAVLIGLLLSVMHMYTVQHLFKKQLQCKLVYSLSVLSVEQIDHELDMQQMTI